MALLLFSTMQLWLKILILHIFKYILWIHLKKHLQPTPMTP